MGWLAPVVNLARRASSEKTVSDFLQRNPLPDPGFCYCGPNKLAVLYIESNQGLLAMGVCARGGRRSSVPIEPRFGKVA